MQQLSTPIRAVPPHVAMEILIDHHGVWGAFRAFLRAWRGLPRRRVGLAEMSDHLRRDIGLVERGEPPPVIRGPWV